MKILVIGGTGVVAEGLIPALLKHKHEVTVLSRYAEAERETWLHGVKTRDADVADPGTLQGVAEGIDAVIHLTGIVEESLPDVTFERVNIQGTRNVVAEAARAKVRRLLYVSSLGADRGSSDYHRSKLAAEEEVRRSPAGWTILRPGGVYGPGDQTISTVLKLVRNAPVVPVVDLGNQLFQPIWYEDLGLAVTRCVESDSLDGETIDLAGLETITVNDLIARLRKLTNRSVPILPIPSVLAKIALTVGGWLRTGMTRLGARNKLELPLNEAKLAMLLEGNFIREGVENGLPGLLRNDPTPLAEGLRRLVDEMPELVPSRGIGRLIRKRFWSKLDRKKAGSAEQLMDHFKHEIGDIMPIDFCAEPGASSCIEPGCTFTAQLPVRGNIQIRVEECDPTSVIFMTIEGHPLAGMVQFEAIDQPAATLFCIEVHSRAGSALDWMAERTFAGYFQNRTWKGVLKRLARSTGCPTPSIEFRRETVAQGEAEELDERALALVRRRKRNEGAKLIPLREESSHLERAKRQVLDSD